MLTPKTANTKEDILKLEKTLVETKKYWFSVHHDYILLVKQESGRNVEEEISVPKDIFNTFIKFYETGKMK